MINNENIKNDNIHSNNKSNIINQSNKKNYKNIIIKKKKNTDILGNLGNKLKEINKDIDKDKKEEKISKKKKEIEINKKNVQKFINSINYEYNIPFNDIKDNDNIKKESKLTHLSNKYLNKDVLVNSNKNKNNDSFHKEDKINKINNNKNDILKIDLNDVKIMYKTISYFDLNTITRIV